MPRPRSRAEIQREYRRRRDADPERRENYLRKERRKYREDLVTGKRKQITNMNEREARKERRAWRNRQKRSRQAARNRANLCTPPASPSVGCDEHQSRQKERGRKCLRRERASAYRRIKELEKELQKAKRVAERYKKKCQRTDNRHMPSSLDTPRTKTRKLLANFHRDKKAAKKVLTFHYALVDSIRKRYQETSTERHKRAFRRIMSSNILRRYKLAKFGSEQFGFPIRRWATQSTDTAAELLHPHKRQRNFVERSHLKDALQNFYVRDDVSRLSAGKKDTITRKKIKKQKRLLTDSLNNCYAKFCSESPHNISYSLFCQLRPFWVLQPTDRDRDTCVCKMHDNLQFIVDKLFNMSLVPCSSIERLCSNIACNMQNKQCMYGVCHICKDSKLDVRSFDSNAIVSCDQWMSKAEMHNGKKTVIVVKESQEMSLFDLVEKLHASLARIRKHLYNIGHQYRSYRELRGKLSEHDCMIQIDFSENFNCKFSREVQAVHFGGSHKQATLQTGIFYVGQQEPRSFCTISDSRVHDPIAVWEYLKPFLVHLMQDFPAVKTLHFFTDGPVTQYRQKKNFYLFSKLLQNYSFLTWNFWEASHGKGPADGIGAALKRSADKLIREGTDIPSAEAMFDKLSLSETSVKLFFVDSTSIDKAMDNCAELAQLPTVPGTMTLHQIIVDRPGSGAFSYRHVSCFCGQLTSLCDCYALQTFAFSEIEKTQQSSTKTPYVQGEECMMSDPNPPAQTCIPPACVLDATAVGKYCIVTYDDKPYPGRILSVDENDVEVDCMHSVPNRFELASNVFYWPKPIKDICFYSFENVVAVIPEPRQVSERGRASSHFCVDASIWEEIKQRFQ